MRQTGFRAFADDELNVDGVRGGWVLIKATGLSGKWRILAMVDILHAGRAQPETIHLHPGGNGRFRAVFFVNPSARAIRLRAFGRLAEPAGAQITDVRRIGSSEAALRLFSRPGTLLRFFRAPSPGQAGWKSRLRQAQAAMIAQAPDTYADWVATFAGWSENDIPLRADAPQIAVLVFGARKGAAWRATTTSLGPTPYATIRPGEDWRRVALDLAPSPSAYVGLLGAGEVLAPHAIDLARSLIPELEWPALAIADEDRIDARGRRTDPIFKPEPNQSLMLSGTLARGLWLIRADALAMPSIVPDAQGHAEIARLDLWLARRRAGEQAGRRLPHVLTSRRSDADQAPPAMLARLVDDHFERSRIPLRATSTWPLRLQPTGVRATSPITAIIPSTLRASHVETCLRSFICGTDAPGLDLIVAVSQPDPLDADQLGIAERLTAFQPQLRIRHFEESHFNFARTVNRAACEVEGAALLLLNDDVAPLKPDWLAVMQAHLADPQVGIVGARLVYPGGGIQHAGIILGLSGFCEHAFRHLSPDNPGYAWRAQLPQRLSAVTGACLLVDAALWRALGGMDEGYPSAYNDVDMCLRADEAGREVVLSDATLSHHELKTFGAHYAGERAVDEPRETARMRKRWSARIEADPFYSPNLDLSPGREWLPSFPPRQSGNTLGFARGHRIKDRWV